MSRILDQLIDALRAAARYNPDVQAAPFCILWTDSERQWEVIVSRLQQEMPELFVLDDYEPSQRRGPAIWLRCILARSLPAINLPIDAVPVFYLPGISRQNLRAVDTCPDPLKPLAELQYRGVIWSQTNAKDWTIMAFLQSAHGGLGLDVAQDKDTRTAMQLALPNLVEADVERFRKKRIDRDDFYSLISADPAGELLKWLDDDIGYRDKKSPTEWKAFIELCDYHFAFQPDREGVMAAAEKLANHAGAWAAIWQRYREAARRYKNIPAQIRRAVPPSNTLEWRMPTSVIHQGWPQWNALHEAELRGRLLDLLNQTPQAARKSISDLEQLNGSRRSTVWAELGEAPLAQALGHLHVIASTSANVPLNGGTLDDLFTLYQTSGWRADSAVMQALACVTDLDDIRAIETAIRAVYLPWAETSARYLQQVVQRSVYPRTPQQEAQSQFNDGTYLLFVDGLRYDVAQRLLECLQAMQFEVTLKTSWAALPSVTATAKPAVSPVRDQITGADSNEDFVPVTAHAQKAVNPYQLTKMLSDAGWQLLKDTDVGNPSGKAWTEIRAIDDAGHSGNLPSKLDSLLVDISTRVQRLLRAGWRSVEIVTDHGWLYIPGGMPKSELPHVLTSNQWGRCAAIKAGAKYDGPMYPWYWNPNQHFALADGISCFRNGIVYSHGGLSLQECVTAGLVVTQGNLQEAAKRANITDVDWRELRCDVFVSGGNENIRVDIRTVQSDAQTSIASKIKRLKANGTVSLVVEDDDYRGHAVFVILLDDQNHVVDMKKTVVGGDIDG